MSNTTLTTRVSGRMSSRGWAIALGVGAIVLAAILLVVYLDRYRARVGGANAPTPVLVAKQVIKQGTPGALVASQAMYQATTLPRKEVELGAISDPSDARGARGGDGHLPRRPADRRPLRRSLRRVGRLADRRVPARHLDLDRQRPRQPLADPGRRLRRHLLGRRTARSASSGRTSRSSRSRRRPARAATATSSSGSRARTRPQFAVRGRQHAAHVRAPPGRGCEAERAGLRQPRSGHLAAAAQVAERDVERPRQSTPRSRARRRSRAGPGFSPRGRRLQRRRHGLRRRRGAALAPRHARRTCCSSPCAGYSDRALLLLDAVARQNPELSIVVLGHGSPNGFLRRAFEAGADDIIMLPATRDQVRFELQKLLARKQGAETPSSPDNSHLVCVLGPKGGTGKTLTATNLAVALAQRGSRVALVDLDLQFGDVALCLGLPPERTIYDLAQSPGALDSDKLDAFLATHSAGVRTLIAPRRPDQASAVGAELLREVYSILRTQVRLGHRRHAAGLHARGDHVDRQLDRHRHGRDARLALAQEHEARARDARADGVRPGAHLPRAEPRAQPRRDQPVGRRGRARPRARRVRPVRPRDPAHGQRGHPDRDRAARSPRRPRRSGASPTCSAGPRPRSSSSPRRRTAASRRRLFGRKA